MKKAFSEVKLPVFIFKEGRHFVAYTPALDLSTSGKSFEEAKRRFNEVVEIFFEEIIKKGTFEEVIQELGWRRINKHWSPPPVIAHETEEIKIPTPK